MPVQVWDQIDPRATPDHLGLIATFIRPNDERPAVDQLTERYGFGWYSMKDAFTLDTRTGRLQAKGDPDLVPLWGTANLRGELIVVYSHAIVAVISHAEGSAPVLVDVARLD